MNKEQGNMITDWLDAVYDGFDELCKTLYKNKINNE